MNEENSQDRDDRAGRFCPYRIAAYTRSGSTRAETLHSCCDATPPRLAKRRGLRGEQGSAIRRRSHTQLATSTRSSKRQPAGKGQSWSRWRDARNGRAAAANVRLLLRGQNEQRGRQQTGARRRPLSGVVSRG